MEQRSFDWYERDNLIAHVVYTGVWPYAELVSFEVFMDDIIDWPFPAGTSAMLNRCFEDRLCPRKNFGRFAREQFGIDEYHAEVMCRIGHGVMPHDTYWMKFEDDDPALSWLDVTLDRMHILKQGGNV